jgi:hypothetical protein
MVHLLKPFELFMTKAMKESVIPADTKLQRALESGRKGRLAKMLPAPATPAAEDFMPESETIAMQLPSRKTEPENFHRHVHACRRLGHARAAAPAKRLR